MTYFRYRRKAIL